MKLKNIEIITINNTLMKLGDQEVKGRLKFKIALLIKQFDNLMQPIVYSLSGIEHKSPEWFEITDSEQEVGDIQTLMFSEIESLDITPNEIYFISPILTDDLNEDKSNKQEGEDK
ncbi:hypothetical protein [Ignavigranum ruoffiae]|uniref:hypothetical protein n=1 Tax=Ignavigranum ruoffiae TaxID=89093 RepID=UPI00235795B5|nr:hypothetical protein [Ignavigranum ruoffiae]